MKRRLPNKEIFRPVTSNQVWLFIQGQIKLKFPWNSELLKGLENSMVQKLDVMLSITMVY